MDVVIPELVDGPLVQALPEFKNLANYGGSTLQDNLKAARVRFNLFTSGIITARKKIAAMPSANLLGSDFMVSKDRIVLGGEPSTASILSLGNKIGRGPEVSAVYKALTEGDDAAYTTEGMDRTISSLIQFLREDDPNIPVSDLISRALARGVKFQATTNRNNSGTAITAAGDVRVPFKVEDGVVKPAVDLSGYRESLNTLNEFARNNVFPQTLSPKKISIRIAATQSDFEAQVRKISPTDRDLSGAQGINFALRSDGTEITRSQDIDGDMLNKTSVIILNHELNEKTPGEFGGANSVAETVYHEYGHPVHRSMGISWGDANAPTPNPKTEKYQTVRGQKVSKYGENNDQEHFAETFAKYLVTGTATPEFKEFLKDQVGIKEFDLNDVYPEFLRGNNLETQFKEMLNSIDLGTFTVKITRFDNPLTQLSDSQLREQALSAMENGRVPSISEVTLGGNIYAPNTTDPVGSFLRTFSRNPSGELSVYHNYFALEDSAQGTGFGRTFIDSSFDLYRSWGLKRVTVSAALANGPYMWATEGFDFMDEQIRTARMINVKDYSEILSEYHRDIATYENMPTDEAALKIQRALDARNIGLNPMSLAPHQAEYRGENGARTKQFPGEGIAGLISAARANGWVIDNAFIAELVGLAKLQGTNVTASMIAELGRRKKGTADKNTSSLGRYIMMRSPWSGKKIL